VPFGGDGACPKQDVQAFRGVERAQEPDHRGRRVARKRCPHCGALLPPPIRIKEASVAAAWNYYEATRGDVRGGRLSSDLPRDGAHPVCPTTNEPRPLLNDGGSPSKAIARHPEELSLQVEDEMRSWQGAQGQEDDPRPKWIAKAPGPHSSRVSGGRDDRGSERERDQIEAAGKSREQDVRDVANSLEARAEPRRLGDYGDVVEVSSDFRPSPHIAEFGIQGSRVDDRADDSEAVAHGRAIVTRSSATAGASNRLTQL
jgi:hypothetical protein